MKEIRAALGLSQDRMRQALKVPFRTYQRYESGETERLPAEVLMNAEALLKRKRGA